MEECCVVCAEPLEWVGYGVCGHRDVCSTCIARLRFVLNNKSCCICKQECNSVLMTKALGDFTKVVKDFESLHDHGDLWYESNIHAYFDDEEHFEMVKAMCRLSCQICEEVEAAESGKDFVKKGYVFRSLDLLRRHLLIGHKVQMCSLCLEGRKIFICEQKLYSRVQMDRHLAKGDSEVDGVGEERGGFSGHPMCDFCRSRFYSDNELYQHMSVDHYICHICQRLHPGHYDYFHKYDDLEIHFRNEHALCEHPDCLAKKFVVFISDAELKRHNALMHGGNMSRSQRNAALQIPVSFQYRWPIQGRVSSRNGVNYSNGQLSVGAQGSIVSNAVELAVGGSLTFCNGTSSHNTKINVAESSARGDESSSRSEPSCGGTGLPCLEESAFPPLPGSKHARRKSKQQTRGSTVSMTTVLGVRDGGRWPSTSSGQSQVHGRTEGDASRSNVSNVAMPNRWSQAPARKTISEEVVPVIHSASALYGRNLTHIGGERVNARLRVAESSSMGETHNVVVPHLTDAVRIANKALIECIRSKLGNDEKLFTAFKDLSAQFKRGKIDASVYYKHIISLGLWELVPELARLCPDPEKQRDLLEAYEKGQKDKQSSALKEDSPSMERSAITQSSARRAKDAVKEDACEQTSIQSAMSATIALRLTDRGGTNGENDDVEVLSKDRYCDLKGKHRAESSSCRSWFSVGSSLVNGAHNPQAKVLVKGTGTVDLPAPICESIPSGVDKCWSCNVCTLENSELDSHCAACETSRSDAASSAATVQAQGHGKRKKKTSKFERARLDDGSLVLSLESRWSDPAMSNPAQSAQRSSGRGAWKNGGGQRLVALAQREDAIESAWKM